MYGLVVGEQNLGGEVRGVHIFMTDYIQIISMQLVYEAQIVKA